MCFLSVPISCQVRLEKIFGNDIIEPVRLGHIPSDIGNLTALNVLSLEGNELSGSFSIANLVYY